MTKQRIPLSRRDLNRVLLTETLPYETPIIFSSDGIYARVKAYETSGEITRALVKALVSGSAPSEKQSCTIPLKYKIAKNETEFRQLSLVHPAAQWKMRVFYEKYADLMLHYCGKSPMSIRAPKKVAGSYFAKGAWKDLRKYKDVGVSLADEEELARNVASFFSYRGFDRLYKFFDSPLFSNLEKKFPVLKTLDVSKCFDSIYTHTLSWAVKDKDFTKDNVKAEGTFAQEFDALMRYANHNETNGIVIGPEISRIYAEIIFQEIDGRVLRRLEGVGWVFDEDYAIRRYVDDVFIFARDIGQAKRIYDCYADVLTAFNLHANSLKSQLTIRPFATQKSKLMVAAGREVREFLEKFLTLNHHTGRLVPLEIHSPWRLQRSFLERLRAICVEQSAGYHDVATYLIAVFCERVKVLAAADVVPVGEGSGTTPPSRYANALRVLVDISYFLYAVAPSVNSSYRLCTAVLVALRFCKTYAPEFYDSLAERIYELTVEHVVTGSKVDSTVTYVPLESLNLILAQRECGSRYLLPEAILKKVFKIGEKTSYFDVISCLYYVRREPQYEALRSSLESWSRAHLGDLKAVCSNSEQAHLLLDLLACPYISLADKRRWVSNAYEVFQMAQPSAAAMNEFLLGSAANPWHVGWDQVDVLSLLERRELKRAY